MSGSAAPVYSETETSFSYIFEDVEFLFQNLESREVEALSFPMVSDAPEVTSLTYITLIRPDLNT